MVDGLRTRSDGGVASGREHGSPSIRNEREGGLATRVAALQMLGFPTRLVQRSGWRNPLVRDQGVRRSTVSVMGQVQS